MNKVLMLCCSVLMVSHVVMADDATCAGGSGTIITGVISGRKYCKSNKSMNWWNAYAWCDAMGKKLIDLNTDCECDGIANCNSLCADIKFPDLSGWGWTAIPYIHPNNGPHDAYGIILKDGFITLTSTHFGRTYSGAALCK